eukprot:scaffold11400_cov65-Cyclotella_meneghiniana.AAC.5
MAVIISNLAKSSALLLLASTSRSQLVRQRHAHTIVNKFPANNIIAFVGTSSRNWHCPNQPRPAASVYIMSRRSNRIVTAASAKISQADDDKMLDEEVKPQKKSPAKGTAKKSDEDGEAAKPTKKKRASPKKSEDTARPSTSEEEGTKSAAKKASPKKRASKGASETEDESKPPAKKKSKAAADHQRWTERTALTRHWDDKTAADSGSYTFTVISWNVAGLRTFIKKNPDVFTNLARTYDADVICLQETKLQEDNLMDPKLKLKEYFDEKLEGYECHFSCSVEKKGYSGTAMFIKTYGGEKKGKKQATLGEFFGAKDGKSDASAIGEGKLPNADIAISNLQPVTVTKELGFPAHDGEGRTITAEFPLFYLTNVYVPNSGQKLERLSYRTTQWDKDFLNKMQQLEKEGKPIIWLGDLNVAYDEKDTWNEGAKHLAKSAGTTAEERASFAEQLSAGYIDAFRHLHPDGKGHYSYWSQRAGNREPNKGLRLDYFICSKDLMTEGNSKAVVRDSYMLPDQLGSDHCPILLVSCETATVFCCPFKKELILLSSP